jgi:hypothetical protein
LIFGDPIRKYARDTYEPSWEDIGNYNNFIHHRKNHLR